MIEMLLEMQICRRLSASIKSAVGILVVVAMLLSNSSHALAN